MTFSTKVLAETVAGPNLSIPYPLETTASNNSWQYFGVPSSFRSCPFPIASDLTSREMPKKIGSIYFSCKAWVGVSRTQRLGVQ